MGACSSRTFLFKCCERPEGERDLGREIELISPPDRLVRNKLRKKVQHNFPNKIKQARNSLSLIQVSPKGLQQKNVRPILSSQANQVSGV